MSIKRLSSAMFVAAFACGFQTPAMATVVISGDYYEQSSALKLCEHVTYCRLDFEPIPADKILDVQRISCGIRSNQPLSGLSMGATSTPGASTDRLAHLPLQANTRDTGNYVYAVNEAATYRMGASRYLFVEAGVDGFIASIRCTMTGKLSPK